MYYVYILTSKKIQRKLYIGITTNIEKRLHEHNNPDKSQYTYKYSPWELETYIVFKDHLLAKRFEVYLKSGSGRAFIRKHLL